MLLAVRVEARDSENREGSGQQRIQLLAHPPARRVRSLLFSLHRQYHLRNQFLCGRCGSISALECGLGGCGGNGWVVRVLEFEARFFVGVAEEGAEVFAGASGDGVGGLVAPGGAGAG